jgi:hypothetical protein
LPATLNFASRRGPRSSTDATRAISTSRRTDAS